MRVYSPIPRGENMHGPTSPSALEGKGPLDFLAEGLNWPITLF